MPFDYTKASALIALAFFFCTTARAEELRATVQRIHGVPTFHLNGKPFTSPGFETYVPTDHYFRQFAGAGTKLFMFNTNAAACDYGHSRPHWVEADIWDYTHFDERMAMVLSAKPDALVIPRVNLGTPRWWLEAHPEALELFEDGSTTYNASTISPTLPKDRPFPSLASEAWRKDIAEALRRFLRHIDDAGYKNHIFGYMLSGMHTEEWYHWSAGSPECLGYSDATTAAFRVWLGKRYQSDEALKKAWNDTGATIDSALPPSCKERKDEGAGTFRNPATAMRLIDFLTFWNELIPDTIDYFAEVVKQQHPHKAVGAFSGYMYEFDGAPEFGHNALGRLLSSDNLDFLAVTASYFDRELGTGADYARSPFTSVQIHGKVWYHDNDTISFLGPKIHKLDQPGRENDPMWGQLRLLGYTPTPQESQWLYRRGMGFVLARGFYNSFFDLHGGYFDDPRLMEEVARLTRVAEDSAQQDRSSVAEILIVSDEKSCAYVTWRNPLLGHALRTPQVALSQIGAPADHVLLEDLDRLDLDPYKLVFFLNTYNMSDADRRIVKRRLKRDGKCLVWCHAAGLFNGNTQSEDAMRDLVGMPVGLSQEPDATPLHSRIVAIECPVAKTGEVLGPGTPGIQPIEIAPGVHEVLGVSPSTNKPNMALQREAEFTSIIVPTPALSPAVYRDLAWHAGVHLYNDRDDTLYVNKSYLTITARDDGERILKFPQDVTVADTFTGQEMPLQGNELPLKFKRGETVILTWKSK